MLGTSTSPSAFARSSASVAVIGALDMDMVRTMCGNERTARGEGAEARKQRGAGGDGSACGDEVGVAKHGAYCKWAGETRGEARLGRLGRGDSGWQNTRSGKERAPGHFRTFEGSVLNVYVLRSRDESPQGSLHTRRCHCPVATRIHHPRRHGKTSSSVCRCTWASEAETVNGYYAALDGAHGRSAPSRLAELRLFTAVRPECAARPGAWLGTVALSPRGLGGGQHVALPPEPLSARTAAPSRVHSARRMRRRTRPAPVSDE